MSEGRCAYLSPPRFESIPAKEIKIATLWTVILCTLKKHRAPAISGGATFPRGWNLLVPAIHLSQTYNSGQKAGMIFSCFMVFAIRFAFAGIAMATNLKQCSGESWRSTPMLPPAPGIGTQKNIAQITLWDHFSLMFWESSRKHFLWKFKGILTFA